MSGPTLGVPVRSWICIAYGALRPLVPRSPSRTAFALAYRVAPARIVLTPRGRTLRRPA
jgi:hypothetical protein